MITPRTRKLLGIPVVIALGGCALIAGHDAPEIAGVVAIGGPLPGARVTAVDAGGIVRSATADAQGAYRINAEGMSAPVVVSAIEAGDNDNCRYNASLRARCMASVLSGLGAGLNVANVNPITDRIVSDVAVGLKYYGPQQLVDARKTAAITPEAVAQARRRAMDGLRDALQAAGVEALDRFDPVSTPMRADRQGVDAVLEVINHNRNYHNPTSESSWTVLTDISFRPIVGLQGDGPYEPLDYPRARRELDAIRNARQRVLIVGDSTAASYELQRMPRMGWGQVFAQRFKPEAAIVVLNGARAGRSSKDFYMGGWYQQMARFLKPGDLVLINHGHNDQNCDAAKKERGAADVAGLCTYPDDASGKPQFPAGHPEMSFRNSLLRYVTLAREAGAVPVLLTPTSRVWNAQRKPGFPVVHQHLTTQNEAGGFAFSGDYSDTIRNAAKLAGVPLIDLEAKTIAFANAHQADWTDYWLAIGDFAKYPWYASQTDGVISKPDTTHFQQRGAEAVAGMVAAGIRETPALAGWAAGLAP